MAAFGQIAYPPQEVRIDDLPSLAAKSNEVSDVLAASVATILHDKGVCCGQDSALADSLASADPLSLKDVAAKLQGHHHLSDGRPVMVTAEFWSQAAAGADNIIVALRDKRALLMQWNSHLYVIYGVVFVESVTSNGETTAKSNVIQKIHLLDLRYSDSRRNVVFDRAKEGMNNVQGLLLLESKPQ